MAETESISLQEELDNFKREKEKIRNFVGQIGGAKSVKFDRIMNTVFIVAITLLFAIDMLRHLAHIDMPIPPLFSIELGVLLVSIKIIWMMHRQMKVEHFQFWILNSIEFRLNDISKAIRRIESEKK